MKRHNLLLPVLMAGSLAWSVVAAPVQAMAIDREEPVSLQPVPTISPVEQLPGFKTEKQGFARGELIVKFKDEAIIGAVAGEMVRGGQPFRKVTGDDGLDHLNRRYKTRSMDRMFAKPATPGRGATRIDRKSAEALHRQNHDEFKHELSAVRHKRMKNKGAAVRTTTPEPNPPYLGSVYRVEIDPDQSVETACLDYARDPNVAYCQPNHLMEVQWLPNDPYYVSFSSWGQGYDDLWGLKKLQTAEAWDVTRGAGVVVAVVDSGVDYNHIDLAANIWTNSAEIPGNGIDDDGNGFIDDVRGWDFHYNDNDPMDGNGHGTHVSGTIAAVGDNGIGVVGVAPSAKIMALKGMSDTGSGSTSNLAKAIKYAADNGAEVMNNSWGCSNPCPSNKLAEDTVKYASDLGTVVVFAAGNRQNDVTLYSPTNQADTVITVASSSELDTRSYFSNLGSLIDVAAPGGGEDFSSTNRQGRNILSLRAGTTDLYADGICIVGDSYYRARGTSMAAPHVAGVAALVMAQHPEFTPADVSQALRATADDIESPGFDLLSGAGRVNALKAVAIASVPRVRLSGTGNVDVSKTGTVTLTGDAFGTNFSKYQLFYASYDKAYENGKFVPSSGPWQELGAESSLSVTDGVLATFPANLFEMGRTYLVKLDLVTSDNLRFSDVREIMLYREDQRIVKVSTPETPAATGPVSAGDRFAWTQQATKANGEWGNIGVVYDGKTNRIVTVTPERTYVKAVHLHGNRIVWTEYNCGLTVIGTITPSGDIVIDARLPYGMFSAHRNRVLLNQGQSGVIGVVVLFYDLDSDILSPEFPFPASGDYSQSSITMSGDNAASLMWYPGQGLIGLTVNLSNLVTGENSIVKVVDSGANLAVAGPGGIAWTESYLSGTSYVYQPLLYFDQTTKQTVTVAQRVHPYSYAVNENRILYSIVKSDFAGSRYVLNSYDIPTGTTTLYAQNYQGLFETYPSFGSAHVQWLRGSDVVVRNDTPLLGPLSNSTVPANTPVTTAITASDPEGDTIDLAAAGGTWPDTTALPDGATFTEHGDGTGSLQWTPITPGVYTISFLARDFSGRKDGTWNSAQTVTYVVYDTNASSFTMAVNISGSGTVNSSPTPDINCTADICSQTYGKQAMVTLTASPAAGFVFSGWSGACSGTGTCTVAMSQARTVTASFTASPATLAATVSGSGMVNSAPGPDITCSSGTCSTILDRGAEVTLTATPAPGFIFSRWSGDCGGNTSCVVTMNEARNVTATFTPVTAYTLTVSVSGNGTVHSSLMPDINCSAGACSGTYNSDTILYLVATPADGSLFTGWSGACSGTEVCNVTMDQAKTVQAGFVPCVAIGTNWQTNSSRYASLGAAFAAVPSGGPLKDIRLQALTFTENVTVSQGVDVTLRGGYDAIFLTRTGTTTIQRLEVINGSLTVSNIEIR